MRYLKDFKLYFLVIMVAMSILFTQTALCAATAESGDAGGERLAGLPMAAGTLSGASSATSPVLRAGAEDAEERSSLVVRPGLHTNFGIWLDENPNHSHYGYDLSSIERRVFEGYLGDGPHKAFYTALKSALQEDARFTESAYLRKPVKEGLRDSIISESFDAVCKIVGISFGAYLMSQLPTDTAGRFENTIWITAVAVVGTVGKSVWKLRTDIKEMRSSGKGLVPSEAEKRIEAEKLALYISLRYLQKDTLPEVTDVVNTFVNWLIAKYPKGEAQSLADVLLHNPEVFDRW